MAFKVFVDSDVVISSLISQVGAAFLLLNQTDNLELFLSNLSTQELEKVIERLGLDKKRFKNFIGKKVHVLQLKETNKVLKVKFADYIFDANDAHIVAGAKKANVRFLITYNTRHFKADKLKEDFNIILTTPANFLQYLRSR